jgi:hypothetical protein
LAFSFPEERKPFVDPNPSSSSWKRNGISIAFVLCA